MLLLSCVLAVTSVLTGYVCEVFVESICNVFRICDFLFTIPHDAHRSCYIPWTHCSQMCSQLPWISDVLFDDMLEEGRFMVSGSYRSHCILYIYPIINYK